MLHLTHVSDSGQSGPQSNLAVFANFDDTLLHTNVVGSSLSCMFSHSSSSVWIVDSGTTYRMTASKDLFYINPLIIPLLVSLPNGYKAKVTFIGSFALTSSITVHNVLFIPSFHHNLIFVSKLI